MFRFIRRKLCFRQILKQNEILEKKPPYPGSFGHWDNTPISSNLSENLKILHTILSSPDFIFRELNIGYQWRTKALLVFLDGMTDRNIINENIIKPLLYDIQLINAQNDIFAPPEINKIRDNLLSVGEVKEAANISSVVQNCLNGNTTLLIDGSSLALSIPTGKWEKRSVEEPKSTVVLRGPQEGFTETLSTNIALLRRKIHDPGLFIEKMQIGARTKTDVVLAYHQEIANPKLVGEVKDRLAKIRTDAILESGYLEAFIEDNPFSVFPTVGNSERPDAIAAKILEGRVAILVDGTPFVLTVPYLFVESFQTPEDYYVRPYYTSVIRLLRYFSYFLSILFPAVYVALASFHQNFIPTPLVLTMARAREGLPFPTFVETLMIGIVFEILREAGMRQPRLIGGVISIIGSLLIGTAAVFSGLVGGPIVITVAITAIASFVVLPQADSSALLRVFLLFLAGSLGAFGILIGMLGILIHLCTLRSLGTPYLSSLPPVTAGEMKDTLIRSPLWTMQERPYPIRSRESKRMRSKQKPKPPKKKF